MVGSRRMLQRSILIVFVWAGALVATPDRARARDVADVPNPQRTHAGWVTDEAHALGAAASSIEARLSRLEQQTGAEVGTRSIRAPPLEVAALVFPRAGDVAEVDPRGSP